MQLIRDDIGRLSYVATIGSFDGVHRGHQHVIGHVVNLARERGLDSRVVTFGVHPLEVLRPDTCPPLLSPGEEKVHLLESTEVDSVAVLDFTPELAQMEAKRFMREVLKERCQVKVLVMGYDNHFGHDGKRFDDYVAYGKELDMEVVRCEELEGGVSSTAIRRALQRGDVDSANAMLGYPYQLQGVVVPGFQNGRKLGYPTANLRISTLKLLPENGVYVVKCAEGYGMLNIGTRPTLHNGSARSIEVHILDFDGDLYGQTLQVELLHRLRGEQEFASLSELKHQLEIDEQECRLFVEV